MADAFPVSGNIDPLSFPHLLVDLHRHGATGSLKVTGPVHPKALYFRGGRVLFGSSNDPRDQLGSILIESGRITREQLDEVNAKVGPGNPLAKVLAESGFVNQRELGEAARMKVESILADVLSWSSGSFEFEDGVLPKGAVDLKLSTEKLLLAAVQRISDRAFALRHIELQSVLEPAPDGETALSEIRADVWPLLERLDGNRTLKEAIALTRLDEFEAVKTSCAMLFMGIVRRKNGAAPVAAAAEVDLAEQAQSGFGESEDTSMYTMPLKPVAVADLPASTGFAFSDATPGYPVPEAEPEPERAPEPVAAAPRHDPYPEAEPDDEPPVFSAETTMLPSAAPIFTMADYLKSAQQTPEPKLAFEPKTEDPPPETVYAMPAPPVVLTPPPPPEPEPVPYNPFTSAPPRAPEPPPETLYADSEAPTMVPEPPAVKDEPPAVLPEGVPSIAPRSPDSTSPRVAPAARPSQEDLAALDALLNPAAAAANRPAAERARQERFEPQFRPPTHPPRKSQARPPAASGSRLPLIFAGIVGVSLATVGAWYFLLRTPEAATPTPRPSPTTVAAAPTTTTLPPPVAAATAAPTAPPLAASATPPPVSAATPPPPTPAPVVAATPTPVPAPTPRPTAIPPAASTSTPAEGRALLRQGSLPEAARSFAATLAPGSRGRFSHQLLTACAPETIAKAVQAVTADDLFILPVTFQGRSCYRLCWGVYDNRAAAEAARDSVPAYFRQSGATPRLSPLNELLP
jgi:hypothetical protein